VGSHTLYVQEQNAAGNWSSSGSRTIVIDTTAPSVDNFTLSDTALKAGDNATVTLRFSEAVVSFSSAADITADNGTLAAMSSADNITWTGTFTPTANTEDASNTLSLATSYTDTAGNAGPAATTLNYVVDTTAPTVSSISTTADNQSSVAITDNITVTFSEAMDNTTVTTNTDNTTCYGSLELSSDNFSSCVQMSSAPASSSDNMTFTLDPYDNLTGGIESFGCLRI
jgi:methionine-rich copper-binding protein CopC